MQFYSMMKMFTNEALYISLLLSDCYMSSKSLSLLNTFLDDLLSIRKKTFHICLKY